MTGIVSAFNAADGKKRWQTAAPPSEPLYHTAMSPLVDRGLVIVHVGGHDKGALTAFDLDRPRPPIAVPCAEHQRIRVH